MCMDVERLRRRMCMDVAQEKLVPALPSCLSQPDPASTAMLSRPQSSLGGGYGYDSMLPPAKSTAAGADGLGGAHDSRKAKKAGTKQQAKLMQDITDATDAVLVSLRSRIARATMHWL